MEISMSVEQVELCLQLLTLPDTENYKSLDVFIIMYFWEFPQEHNGVLNQVIAANFLMVARDPVSRRFATF